MPQIKQNTLLLFSLFLCSQAGSQTAYQLSSSCTFYDSLEVSFVCGKRGYALNYGKKFCEKFSKETYKFSKEGQIWLDNTMLCLQQNLYDLNPNLSCKALRKKAFDSHIPCYLDNGYCDLDTEDKKLVVKTVFLSSLFRPRTWRPSLKVLRNCRKERRKQRRQE